MSGEPPAPSPLGDGAGDAGTATLSGFVFGEDSIFARPQTQGTSERHPVTTTADTRPQVHLQDPRPRPELSAGRGIFEKHPSRTLSETFS